MTYMSLLNCALKLVEEIIQIHLVCVSSCTRRDLPTANQPMIQRAFYDCPIKSQNKN